ncbi:MAG: VOC family protein [Nannocystales bacterium]
MELGAFSVSLTVQDLDVSKAFYEKLGFEVTGGNAEQGWLILLNGTTTIGLFHGMFDRNLLTFNPGWNKDKTPKDAFEDVRALHASLKAAGLEVSAEAGLDGTGPGSFMVVDPDGNPVLIDQHVPKPGQ